MMSSVIAKVKTETAMSTERDLYLANLEVARRRQEAAEERLARQSRARHSDEATEPTAEHEQQPSPFAWLRRLADRRS
jgi:uncharacterized membrane protein YdbT with pleckstrin-like domain